MREVKTDNFRLRAIYRVTLVGVVVDLLSGGGKLAAGLLGRSSAMVADAVHSISDLVTDVVVLVFAKISVRPRDPAHPYGYGKYETLATVVISLFLGAVGIGILWDAAKAILQAVRGELLSRPRMIALVAAVLSIVIKEALYRYTVRVGRRQASPSVVANAWHHRSDALSSVCTCIGIGCAYFLGERWRVADPVVAVIVAGFIIKVACVLLNDGLGELLEKALPPEVEQEIRGLIAASSEVCSVHTLRTRRIGPAIAVEAAVRVDGGMEVARAHAVAVAIEERLQRRFGAGTVVTIQIEPAQKKGRERR